MSLVAIMKSKVFIILALFLASLGGIVFYFFFGTPWDLVRYKNTFESYLEDKYNQDFVINSISYDLIHGGTYHAYAFASEEEEVLFYVGQNPQTGEIEDGFHYELWSSLVRQEWNPLIENLYPDKFNHAVGIRTILDESALGGPDIPDYKDATTIEVGISMIETEFTNESADFELKRAFELIDQLRSSGVRVEYFGVDYKSKALRLNEAELKDVHDYRDLEKWLFEYR